MVGGFVVVATVDATVVGATVVEGVVVVAAVVVVVGLVVDGTELVEPVGVDVDVDEPPGVVDDVDGRVVGVAVVVVERGVLDGGRGITPDGSPSPSSTNWARRHAPGDEVSGGSPSTEAMASTSARRPLSVGWMPSRCSSVGYAAVMAAQSTIRTFGCASATERIWSLIWRS